MRGLSSALSAASSACDHVRDWVLGTAEGTWVSMGVICDGSYGQPEGIVYSFPCTCKAGEWSIVQVGRWACSWPDALCAAAARVALLRGWITPHPPNPPKPKPTPPTLHGPPCCAAHSPLQHARAQGV
jgi:hypothetical protein